MDREKINDINKSFALGMTPEQVSANENIDLATAEQLLYDNADEIASLREYIEQMGGM